MLSRIVNDTRCYVSTWRDMKAASVGHRGILYGVFRVRLKPVPFRPGVYCLHYVSNDKHVSHRTFTVNSATEKCRLLFREQLSEWEVERA